MEGKGLKGSISSMSSKGSKRQNRKTVPTIKPLNQLSDLNFLNLILGFKLLLNKKHRIISIISGLILASTNSMLTYTKR